MFIFQYFGGVLNLCYRINEIPLDVVCSRYNGENKEEVTRHLRVILHSFYVAIYRLVYISTYDISFILEFFISSHSMSVFRCSDHSLPIRWIVSSLYPHSSLVPSLSNILNSPCSPILAPFLLTAVAGPFDTEKKANEFQRRWKGQVNSS